MPYPKSKPLEKKHAISLALSKRVILLLDKYSEELTLSRSSIAEMFLQSGLKDYMNQFTHKELMEELKAKNKLKK